MFATFKDSEGASAHIDEYSEKNILFHQAIIRLSKCDLLVEIAEGLFIHMHSIRSRTIRERQRVTDSIIDHMHIIEALEKRDAELSERYVREHTNELEKTCKRLRGLAGISRRALIVAMIVAGQQSRRRVLHNTWPDCEHICRNYIEDTAMGIKTILVPIDGSKGSFAALSRAFVVANRFGSHIKALHVMTHGADIAAAGTYNLPAKLRKSVEGKADKAGPGKSR